MGCILESEYGNEVSAEIPLIGLISAGLGTVYMHDGLTANVKTTFSVENSSAGGSLAIAGGDLLVVRRVTVGTLYRMNGITGTTQSSFALADAGDITVYNGNLISIKRKEGEHDAIRIHDGISATVSSSFNAPTEDDVQGIAVDSSGNLITASENSDLIYIHSGITSTVSSSFSTPAANVRALAIAPGDILISTDDVTNTIYIHDGISATIRESFPAPGNGIVVFS